MRGLLGAEAIRSFPDADVLALLLCHAFAGVVFFCCYIDDCMLEYLCMECEPIGGLCGCPNRSEQRRLLPVNCSRPGF